MKLEWPNVIITMHDNFPDWKLSVAMKHVVEGKNIAHIKPVGLFRMSEKALRETISSAEELAMYEMVWKAEKSGNNVVTCFQFQYVPIGYKQLLVIARGQGCFGEQIETVD